MQTASVKWTGHQQFVALSPSGHSVPVDSDRESNTAPGPMELVLMVVIGGLGSIQGAIFGGFVTMKMAGAKLFACSV